MIIGTALVDIPLGIKDVSFNGVLRIELRDLVPTPPLISAVVIYFTRPPTIDFDLTKAANVGDLPMLFKTVRKKIVDVVSSALVCPKRIVIPLANRDPSIYKWPIPKYLVRVNIIKAEDLINTDEVNSDKIINPNSRVLGDISLFLK